jgi:hypothetical protein
MLLLKKKKQDPKSKIKKEQTGHIDITGRKIKTGDKVSVIYYNNLYEAIVTRHTYASIFFKITNGPDQRYWNYHSNKWTTHSLKGLEARTMTSERKLRIIKERKI